MNARDTWGISGYEQSGAKVFGGRASEHVGRWRKGGCAGLVGLAALALLGQDALATHQIAHCRPEPANILFAPDFPALQDHEWGYPIGGWGGIAKGALKKDGRYLLAVRNMFSFVVPICP